MLLFSIGCQNFVKKNKSFPRLVINMQSKTLLGTKKSVQIYELWKT